MVDSSGFDMIDFRVITTQGRKCAIVTRLSKILWKQNSDNNGVCIMKYSLMLLSLFLAQSVFAGTELVAQQITVVASGWNNNDLYVTTDLKLSAENCSTSDQRMVLEETNVKFDMLVSMILTAQMSKSNVAFYINGCTSTNLMRLQAIKIITN